jgi:MSHA pilin protein MshC
MRPKQGLLINQFGFSLIELVVVIIIISVLAVSVFSRFTGTSGFAEYTYQARLISALRNMQTRAMHDNRDDYCFKINFDTSSTPAFGPPTLTYAPVGSTSDTCSNDIDFTNPDYLRTTSTEMADESVTLSTSPVFALIDFDGLGRPIDGDGDPTCTSTCTITLTGESAVNVCIESQGFIHACD